tara:strand:- start:587 stop:739 length:153 start_codon:yes stop_codon:yes gene_type:complete
MAAFVRVFAQKVTAEICPVQPFVRFYCAHARNQKAHPTDHPSFSYGSHDC